MKILKSCLMLFFFAVSITGCSDEDTEVIGDDVSSDSFTYTVDGQTINAGTIVAQRSEDNFAVNGLSADGRAIQVLFNKYGNLGEVSTYSVTNFDVPDRANFKYYKSHYFNFELVSFDEATRKVRVAFSGKVYDDEYDLESDFSVVEGSFTATYTDVAPLISGMQVSAKINGNQWYATETGEQSGGFFSGSDITLHASNDSQYMLSTTINHETTAVGTYNFTNSSTTNKVELSAYEITTRQDITFPVSSGTLTITEKTVTPQYTVIAGTYSFTARNPYTQGTMTVSNGSFKRTYLNY